MTFRRQQQIALRAAVKRALEKHSVREAARILGMPPSTLHDLAIEHQLAKGARRRRRRSGR